MLETLNPVLCVRNLKGPFPWRARVFEYYVLQSACTLSLTKWYLICVTLNAVRIVVLA